MREGIRLIHKKIQELLLEDRDKLFIDAEKVAILQEDHTLEHAMLVLTNVRYSLIPVLNKENKIVGLISLQNHWCGTNSYESVRKIQSA